MTRVLPGDEPSCGDSDPVSGSLLRTRCSLRVLLIEDNEGDVLLVREHLSESPTTNFQLVHAEDLRGAMAALRTGPFDLVLTDLSLPDAGGLQVLLRLREVAPQIPIVVMTGTDSEETDQASIEQGIYGYVVKSEITPTSLSRHLRHAAERARIVRELEEAREDARQLATRDPLTGLANRLLVEDRLSRLLAAARRHGDRVAILALDLDRFKAINDAFGHEVGDDLLRCVSNRLMRQVRESDTVARFGGDEFVVLLTNLAREMDAARVAGKILSALTSPISIGGHEYLTNASIGIATFPGDGRDPRALLRAADTAMYHAKRNGAGRYHFYREEMTEDAIRRLELERDLRYCIARCELLLHYQPVVDLDSGELTGVEALVRWRHPVRGLLSPGSFISIAEETGEILPIGEWVFREAARQCAEWRERYRRPLSVSVNVAPRQLRDHGFPHLVKAALEEFELPPDALVVEITESSLIDLSNGIDRSLRGIATLGVPLELDDFGTGYSCLAELREVPVRAIKVDRCFVSGLPTDDRDVTIVSTINRLARGFHAATIAEGIETVEQLEAVRDLGCEFGQGFLLQPPVPAEEIEVLLREGRARWWEKEQH